MLAKLVRGSSVLKSSTIVAIRNSVSAADVKNLRELSGAPMMDCKKALLAPEVEGDVKKAIDWLRKKGIAKATSQADRTANEGLIAAYIGKDRVSLLEVNSETDFVSRNQDFQTFVSSVVEAIAQIPGNGHVNVDDVLQSKSKTANGIKTVKNALLDAISTIRENIVIKRAENIGGHQHITTYLHNKIENSSLPAHIQMGRTASVVCLNVAGGSVADETLSQLGKKLAMHVVVANPQFLDAKDVSSDVITKETEIAREQSKDDKKKPEIVEKVVQGKVAKRLNDICLLGQAHMAEEGNPVVKKHLEAVSKASNTTISISSFVRWSLASK